MNIAKLYSDLHDNGLVQSQYEFSKLCGRKKTWFSSIKCRNRPITIAALHALSLNLAAKARQYPKAELDCAYASARVRQLLDQQYSPSI